MASEILPHACLEDGDISFGMQSAAVDDRNAFVATALMVDELLHVRDGFHRRLAMQIEDAAGDVVSAF